MVMNKQGEERKENKEVLMCFFFFSYILYYNLVSRAIISKEEFSRRKLQFV